MRAFRGQPWRRLRLRLVHFAGADLGGGADVSAPSSKPLVIEKHRHLPDGSETVSFYACGPVRDTLEEAKRDAVAFSRLAQEASGER